MVRFSPQRHGGWPYIKSDPGSQQHHAAEKLKITCKCYSAQPLCDLFFEFTFDVYVLPTGHLTIMDLQSFCYLFCSTRSFLQTFKDVSQLLVYFLWFWIQPSGKQILLTFYGPFTMLLIFYLISNTGLWPRTMLFSHLISFISDKRIRNETLWLIWHPINNSRGFLNLHFSLKILGGKMHILKKEKKTCLY